MGEVRAGGPGPVGRYARLGRSARAKLADSPLALGGLSFVGASAAVSVSNLAFHAAVSRLLGPTGYGALGSLLNVVVVLSVPLGALEAAVTRAVATWRGAGDGDGCRRLSLMALSGGLAAFALWSGLSPFVASFLHLRSALPVLLMGLWIVPTTVGAVWQGTLIGQLRFRPVAVSQLLGSGLARLAAGVALVAVGLGIDGAVLATVAASLVGLALMAPALRSQLSAPGRSPLMLREAAWTVASLGGVAALSTLDSWLGRHYLPPAGAGFFAAGTTAGRIALFVPGAMVLVAFPRLARAGGRGPEARAVLTHTLAWVGATAGGAAALLVAVPGVVVAVLFGAWYGPTASLLRILAPADAAVALMSTLVYYQLARRSRLAAAGWAGCALMALLGTLLHATTHELAWMMLAADATTLACLAAATAAQSLTDRPRPPAPAGPLTASPSLPVPVGRRAPESGAT